MLQIGIKSQDFVMSDSEDSTAPPSPDYVPGPEHPPSLVYVSYVPKPVYPEFMPPEDDVLPAEEQPLPAAVSPTTNLPGYITESDSEEDPEEDDEDPEEDPTDYPTNRDDDEEEPSEDDADNKEEDEDEDEEEEHLALADSVPPPTCRTTATMSIRDKTPILFPPMTEVDRFLAISTPLPSPLTSYSSPPTTTTAMIQAFVAMMRAAALSTYILASQSETPPSGTPPLLPIPLPTPSPPLLLPSTICRASVFEVTLLPWKRLCIALGQRFEVSKSSSAPTARPTGGFKVDYGLVGTLDDEIRRYPEREDTDEIYGRLDDAQDDRSLMSGQLNMLRRHRRAHACTVRLMESEARLSREA
ncbi:hypothetical protein Tco_0327778 [Tanacetum coccineum]